MHVEHVDPTELEPLMGDWEVLHREDPLATPFSSPEWARACLACPPDGETPYVLRVVDGGGTAAIAPLTLRRRAGVRTLGMLGKEPGDFWDIVAGPEVRHRAARAVGVALAARRGEWDVAILSCLPQGSSTDVALEEAGLRVRRRTPVVSPAMALPSAFEDYLATLPKRRRSNVRRHLRRLDDGPVTMERVLAPERLASAVAHMHELRRRQWDALGKTISPSHTTPSFRGLVGAATEGLARRDAAVVWELRSGGRLAGVYLAFADADTTYWYLGGFEPELRSLGVGKIAVAGAIRWSIETGRRRFDFTRGDEAYKFWFGAHEEHVASLVVGNASPRSRLVLPAVALEAARRDRRAAAGAADPASADH